MANGMMVEISARASLVASSFLRNLLCQRVMLTAIVSAGMSFISIGPAPAATPHRGRIQAAAISSKHPRLARPAQGREARVRPPQKRVNSRKTAAVHPGVVPLVNAAWDSPAISPAMLVAIRQAADDMSVDPHLLMALAWRESRFDPAAANRLSSARGLLQFTSETWLQNVREFGARHGAAEYAIAVEKGPSGEMVIRDKDTRETVLKLRDDPVLSARLATEAMVRQRAAMKASLGRSATSADFFLLHVLGPTGSARFLAGMAKRPSASSLEFASPRVLRNAGLLASDGRPMTVANTYKAIQRMLAAQRIHSGPLLAGVRGH